MSSILVGRGSVAYTIVSCDGLATFSYYDNNGTKDAGDCVNNTKLFILVDSPKDVASADCCDASTTGKG